MPVKLVKAVEISGIGLPEAISVGFLETIGMGPPQLQKIRRCHQSQIGGSKGDPWSLVGRGKIPRGPVSIHTTGHDLADGDQVAELTVGIVPEDDAVPVLGEELSEGDGEYLR